MRPWDFLMLLSSYSLSFTLPKSTFFTRNLIRIDVLPPFIRRLVPEDILNKISKVERYIFQGKHDVAEAPEPILDLATDLAIEQLIQTVRNERYFSFDVRIVSMTTRNNVEKRAVLAKVAALNMENMVGSGKRFERVISIDVSKCKSGNEVRQEFAAQLGLQTKVITKNDLVLLMDGDGDQDINPLKAVCRPCNMEPTVVFITTESAAARRWEYVAHVNDETEIRTEDHLLPWVVFCRNVGSDLVRSSSGIQRIAVQIVEECRGNLHVCVMVASLLKNVQDVEVWECTLQKLRSTSLEVKYVEGKSKVTVNAFIIFWESLDSVKKDCLKFCQWVFSQEDSQMHDHDLTSKWVRYGFLDTEQVAEYFLEELLSFSFLRRKSYYIYEKDRTIYLPDEICETLSVIIKSESHNEGAWHGPMVIDAQLSHLPQSPDYPQLRVVFLKDNPDLIEIPQLFFHQMPRLRTLDLSQTSLKTLPSSVINLMGLKVLKLSYCKSFYGLPTEIGKLDNLEKVHLEGTRIEHLPPSPNWPRVTQLFLQNNLHLTELPPLFFNHMPLLQNLDLSSTSIKGLPHSFCKLMELYWLSLSGCKHFMNFLPEIGDLKNIENIYFDGTRIEHLPPSPHLPLLEELNLSSTSIKELPPSFSKLMNLRRLYLSDCELLMKLPPEYGALKCLNELYLDGTYLLHSLEEMKELTNLEKLILSFYGSPCDTSSTIIPTGVISNLKSLSTLIIHVNSDYDRWYDNAKIILPEIARLQKLSVLKLYIPGVKLLDQLSICTNRMRECEFIVGHQMQQRIISRIPPTVAAKLREGKKSLKYVNGEDTQEISMFL